jgi:prepilin-type N-terminal cleavage/methylation domain-containing protein
MKYLTNYKDKGFTLIEVLIAIFYISILSGLILITFWNLLKVIIAGRISLQILSILEDEMEYIKIVNYEDIGTRNGWPRGILPDEKYVNLNGLNIKIKYFIRNIDDPSDGTVNSTPQDTAPADYKLVELEGECINCSFKVKKQTLTFIVAPKTVESSTRNGSMFIRVIDANGNPVPYANILVVNNAINPQLIINDLSNINGELQLIDIPTGTNIYEISVSKENYSLDRTYPPFNSQDPNSFIPEIPHQTVIERGLTIVTFMIDKLSNLKIQTIDNFCNPIPNIPITLEGEKIIGRYQNEEKVKKTIISTTTDTNGTREIKIEWDNYTYKINSAIYSLIGYNSSSPLTILPDRNYYLRLNMNTSSPKELLVIVKDINENPLKDAEVEIIKNNFRKKLITNQLEIKNASWTEYFSDYSSNILLTEEQISLRSNNNLYPTNTQEWVISPTIDIGTSSNSKIISLRWEPINQPDNTEIKFQIAFNNDNLSWNFIGPDGTSDSYFTSSPINLSNITNGYRYFKFKAYLSTNNENQTPTLEKVYLRLTSNCLSPNQVIFQNLREGNYTLNVSKQGFQPTSTEIYIDKNYREIEIILQPQ